MHARASTQARLHANSCGLQTSCEHMHAHTRKYDTHTRRAYTHTHIRADSTQLHTTTHNTTKHLNRIALALTQGGDAIVKRLPLLLCLLLLPFMVSLNLIQLVHTLRVLLLCSREHLCQHTCSTCITQAHNIHNPRHARRLHARLHARARTHTPS